MNKHLTIFTIGVYGFSEDGFFTALKDHEIDLFIDIRARRGMRGAKYKFVNSSYLQAKLKEMGIGYAHLKELAPTPRIRGLQEQADQKQHLTRRSDRQLLCEEYVREYKRDILRLYKRKPERKFYAAAALAQARELAGCPEGRVLARPALFCVEGKPLACHRSLAAAEMKRQLGVKVEHILAKQELLL